MRSIASQRHEEVFGGNVVSNQEGNGPEEMLGLEHFAALNIGDRTVEMNIEVPPHPSARTQGRISSRNNRRYVPY